MFKVGDRVRRVEECRCSRVVKGKEYTVSGVSITGKWINLKETERDFSYMSRRFELVEKAKPKQDTYVPEVGDVVQLKSGGPEMTVSSILGENGAFVRCWWFYEGRTFDKDFPLRIIKFVR